MDLQNAIFEFIEFCKKFILTFWFSITKTRKFFLTSSFKNKILNGRVFLFTSLFIYLIYFSIRKSVFNLPEAFKSADKVIDDSNFFQIVAYTLPLLLYIFLLIQILTYKRIANNLDVQNFGYILFSAPILTESFLWFIISIIYSLLRLIIQEDKLNGLLYSSFPYILNFIRIMIFIVPLVIGITMIGSKKELRHVQIFLLILVCCYADNIVYGFYRAEFNILSTKNYDIQIINTLSGNENEWDFAVNELIDTTYKKKGTTINKRNALSIKIDTSYIFFSNFILKNNTDQPLIIKMNWDITCHPLVGFETDVDDQLKCDSFKDVHSNTFKTYACDTNYDAFVRYISFIYGKCNNFFIDGKLVNNNVVIEPHKIITGRFVSEKFNPDLFREMYSKLLSLQNMYNRKFHLKLSIIAIKNNGDTAFFKSRTQFGKMVFNNELQ